MLKLNRTYKIIALAIAILFSINDLKAQCEIHLQQGVTLPVCYNDKIILSVDYNINYSYEWKHNNETIGETNEVFVTVTQNNSVYQVFVTNTETGAPICSPSITITMHPEFEISYNQVALTCSDGNNAKVRVEAHGGGYSNFQYSWDSSVQQIQQSDNNQYVIGLRAFKEYKVTVTNEIGCSQTKSVFLKAYPNPNIIMSADPDTVYLDNPYTTWSFENTETHYVDLDSVPHDTIIEISNFYWKFDGYDDSFTTAEPQVAFHEEGYGNAYLTVTSDQGCDTTYNKYIDVLPVNLKIPNIFTPNGDGINDYFEIGYGENGTPIQDLNRYFLSHKLTIFNRWGRIVYKSSNYSNDWSGGDLPDGTYFYVLECKGETKNYKYQGSVMIWNSGR